MTNSDIVERVQLPGDARSGGAASERNWPGLRQLLPFLPPDRNRSQPFGLEVLDSNRVIALAQVDVSE